MNWRRLSSLAAPSGCHCHTGFISWAPAQSHSGATTPEGEAGKHPIPSNSPWSSVPASEGAVANDLEVIHPLSGNLNLAEDKNLISFNTELPIEMSEELEVNRMLSKLKNSGCFGLLSGSKAEGNVISCGFLGFWGSG